MGWRRGEVWFDADFLWFREQEPFGGLALAGAAGAVDLREPPAFGPVATGLDASRRRRAAAAAARRRKRATRTVPAVALVLGSATMLPIAALRGGGPSATPLGEDPPTLTFRLNDPRLHGLEESAARAAASERQAQTAPTASVDWNHAHSIGLPFSGRLVEGTQLPVEGPDWVTWSPATDSSPNQASRLYGNERTIRAILDVVTAYRATHPRAPRVVVGDISRRGGGWMNEHVSHQNGLDVDVYYPRRDRRLRAPASPSQVDRRLAQDLLDRFLAAGAQIVFVGYSSGLRGPGGVVVPYPNHENHMHVRFPQPRG
jgi:penicillin-insensitive murein endopeptidase